MLRKCCAMHVGRDLRAEVFAQKKQSLLRSRLEAPAQFARTPAG